VIIVVGLPSASHGPEPAAAGLAVDIARAASEAGATVQLAGKVGDDPEGDAVLADLARAGIGHAAILRDPALRTPVAGRRGRGGELAPSLEPADVELALRYMPDFLVLVLAVSSAPGLIGPAGEAAGFAGAHLIALVGRASRDLVPSVPGEATILKVPAADPERGFGTLVGRYAAGLDAGQSAAAAWRAASDLLALEGE
jgi:hypothetical protein